MKPLRVLALIDSLDEPGGAERLAVTIATALPADRFEVVVCATRTAGGELTAALDAAGVEWVALGRRGKFDVLPFRRLRSMLRERQIDVVHSHMFGSNLWAALIAPRSGVRALVAHEHGSPYDGRLGRLIRLLDHRVIGPASAAVVVGTEAERRRLIEAGGIEAAKVNVIPAPYVERGNREVDLRAQLGLAAGTPLVGSVAWLRPEKALGDLIAAFAMLPGAAEDAHLVLAGDGPCRAELEAEATAQGVAQRTHFLGPRDDALAVLGALDVTVISSLRESTSLVALESIAAGTPLVSTRVGGPAEFLESGRSALLVEPADRAGLAEAIATVLSDRELGRRLAAAAQERLEEFSVERVVASHAALYERVLASSAQTAS